MAGEWKRLPLGEFVTLQRGHDLPDENRQPGFVPILGSFGITGWHDKAKARGPGVTVGRSGASYGVISYSATDYWPLNTALYVVDFHGNDERFAYYFLKMFDFKGYNSGSAQPSLNRNFVHPVPVDIPPLAEQQTIAHILGTLDDKIELNRRMNATLEEVARAIFKSWFVDFEPVRAKMERLWQRGQYLPGLPADLFDLFPDKLVDSELGEIPEGWVLKRYIDTIVIFGGSTPNTSIAEYWNGDIPWFSIADAPAQSDIWVIDTAKKISTNGLTNSSTTILPVGTTIISARGTVGKVALVARPMAMNQSCYAFRSKISDKGFYTYFCTRDLVARLQQRAHGSVFDTITRDTIASVLSISPPDNFVKSFDDFIEPFILKIRENLYQARTLASLRDTLLPKLISGQIRVKDAERFLKQRGL